MEAMSDQKRYVGVPYVAKLLEISTNSARALVVAGTIPAFRFGRRFKIDRSDLARYVESARLKPKGGSGNDR